MEDIQKYMRINQILLSIVTLWPYQQSLLTRISRIFLLIIVASLIFFQLMTFLTFEYTIDFFIMILSYVIPYFLCIIQYYFFYTNSDKVKQLWKNIYDNWNSLKDETECNIMQRYSCIGELITICLMLLAFMGIGAYGGLQFLPLALDIVLPLNEPRPHKVYALTEYFIDSETYFYPILCHWLLGLFLSALVLIATCTFLVVYIQHICGLLKIACYRITQSVDEWTAPNLKNKNHTALEKISAAVNIHLIALECADFLTSTFVSITIVMAAFGVLILNLSLLRLLRAILLQNTNELFSLLMFVLAQFIIMFLCNYFGQQITDHNSEIFNNTYNVRWYVAPVKIQKLLLFIMRKTAKTYTLNVGNTIAASVENFAKLVRLSMSYFTVIYSLMK